MKVFLSYRRDDSAAYAGRLRDTIAAHLGAGNTFLDVSTIRVGEDFEVATGRALDAADVELVVIGPDWLRVGPDGTSRLSDPGDYVRLEVLRALQRDMPVVPVLVGGAELPEPAAVPEELRPLLLRQAVRLRDESWHEDVSALLDALSGPPQEGPARPRRWLVAAGVATIAIAGSAALYALQGGADESGSPDSEQSDSLGPCDGLPLTGDPDSAWTALVVPDQEVETVIATADGSVGYTATAAFYRAVGAGQWQVGIRTLKTQDRPEEYHGSWNYSGLLIDDIVAAEGASCFEASPDVLSPGESGRAVVGFDAAEDPLSGPVTLEVETDTESDSGSQFDRVPVTQ